MKTVNRDMLFESGDRFIYHNEHKTIYTLQKLPDFHLWILIGEFNDMWMAPIDSPFKAFGGWHQKFEKVNH